MEAKFPNSHGAYLYLFGCAIFTEDLSYQIVCGSIPKNLGSINLICPKNAATAP